MSDTNVTNAAGKVVDAAADAIKTAAKTTTAEPKAPKVKIGEPKAYVSDADVYVDGRYYKLGEVFVTGQPKGDTWEEVSPKVAAAIQASTDRVPDDANLEGADKSALQAVAIIKHVNITGLDKPALITAIKAADAPKL